MIEMSRRKPEEVFTEEDKRTYTEFCRGLREALEASGLPESKQREIYNDIVESEKNRIATNRLAGRRSAVAKKADAINDEYKKETNPRRARQLAKEFNELYAKLKEVDEERLYFLKEYREKITKARQADSELTAALERKGYKDRENYNDKVRKQSSFVKNIHATKTKNL